MSANLVRIEACWDLFKHEVVLNELRNKLMVARDRLRIRERGFERDLRVLGFQEDLINLRSLEDHIEHLLKDIDSLEQRLARLSQIVSKPLTSLLIIDQ